jgi:NADH:ubiquinone oxidoreductase subunit 3 (subunit A)
MTTAVLGFVAMFLVVFVSIVAISRIIARKAQQKEDQRAWEEGQRRRAETEDEAAWRANKRMPMK